MLKKNILIFLLGMLLYSCGSEVFVSEVKTINSDGWNADESHSFNFDLNEDNTKDLDLFIHLQHNNDYRFQNIYFFSKITFPDFSTKKDTLQYYLAEKNGKWMGSGMSNSKTILLHYPINLRQKGNYKLELTQAMRTTKLTGIEKLAISIEHGKN